MTNTTYAFILSFMAGLSTLLGCLPVFLKVKKKENIILCSLAFAGGVMICVSITDLIPEAKILLNTIFKPVPSFLLLAIFFTMGLIFSMLIDKLFPQKEEKKLKNSKLSGTLTIGTTRNIADNKLSKYILKLTKLYPEISVKVWIDNASNLSEMLKKHTIDVLIDYLPFKNDYENKDVIIQKIDSFKTFFACNKNFYEKEKNNIKKISDLNNYNLIIPGSSRRRDILENLLQQVNVKLVAKIQIPDSKLMADLVLNSNYIGYFIEEEINLYNLAKIHLNVETPDNEIGLIYYKSSVSEETSKLIEIILE